MRTLLLIAFCGMLHAQSLTPTEAVMAKAIEAEAEQAILLLEKVVNVNSGTFNPEGVKKVAKIFESEFKALGFTTRYINLDSVKRAPHLVAERTGTRGKNVLLIGHMDTVFEPSSPFQRFERKGTTAVGPGVSDMKGGVIVMLSALKAMQKAGVLDGTNITVFLTADEEAAGHPVEVSRKEFIEAGKKAAYALCFETGSRRDDKDYASTARRGSSSWRLKVSANSGHSGAIFSDRMGDGAINELSRIINAFREDLREPNLTYSVGMVLGGADAQIDPGGHGSVNGKSNIVPGEALAIGDIRALYPDQLARVKDKMHSILSKNLKGTKAELTFSEGYPPMAPTPGNVAILNQLNEGNRALGAPVMEALDPMLRGAGDISFIAPYVDSLSGLGANGIGGAHAPGEGVDLKGLPLQSKRAALLIFSLTK